jgi:hypothetical protein
MRARKIITAFQYVFKFHLLFLPVRDVDLRIDRNIMNDDTDVSLLFRQFYIGIIEGKLRS